MTFTDKVFDWLKNKKLVAFLILLYFIIRGSVDTYSGLKSIWDDLFPPEKKVSAKELITENEYLGKELIKYSKFREINEPKLTLQNPNEYREQKLQYSAETISGYMTEFYPRIIYSIKELEKHGIIATEADSLNIA